MPENHKTKQKKNLQVSKFVIPAQNLTYECPLKSS